MEPYQASYRGTHLARNPDFGLHAELAASGAYLAYDGPRRDTHATDWRLGDLICAMLKAGYGDRILLGADTPNADRLDAPRWVAASSRTPCTRSWSLIQAARSHGAGRPPAAPGQPYPAV